MCDEVSQGNLRPETRCPSDSTVPSPLPSTSATVVDCIVSTIVRYTDYLFGVGGANIEDLYDAVHRSPVPLTGIVAKHEFGAATMADGYARATNRLGVVAATSGGGALNLIAALGESFDSRIPVLALVGLPPIAGEGHGAFQDMSGSPRLDAERIFGAVSRYCAKLTRPDDIADQLGRAVAIARTGGPSVLLLPKDVQSATVSVTSGHTRPDRLWNAIDMTRGTNSAYSVAPPFGDGEMPSSGLVPSAADSLLVPIERLELPRRTISDVVALLRDAKQGRSPITIIAGPEVARADARRELEAFAGAVDASVAVTPDAKDAFPNRNPGFVGVTGVMGHPQVPGLVAAAGLCVLVGAQLPTTARAGLENALERCPRAVYLGTEPPFVPVDVHLDGPLRPLLLELTAELDGSTSAGPCVAVLPEVKVPPSSGPGIRYGDAVRVIAAQLEPGTDIVVDAGNTGAAVVHHLPVPDGGRFLIALGMGGMGYAFGAGIGTALGRRRRTFVIAGDGAYFMHGHEIHTAVQHHVPVTFVVFNNNAHAMCVTREQLYYSGEYTYNRFGAAHIGLAIAAMFPHLPAHSATTIEELRFALERTSAAAGPVFIEVVCDADELPPFAPFLKELTA
ncbi:thiamine pyrophosphate-binding protein [Nocardia abscessus]|uniref:thiamine pyrophosphate-binding protein n=1 Tax=Nocardia abscessus TaxID=120957 RepID=UPI0024572220|nr:thiamine pyrophosphate-binding protein [Nocardia abscessus]